MKTTFTFLIIFLLAGFLSINVESATEEWSYDCGSNVVYQAYTDGKGGAAMVYGSPPANTTLVWLDKKGDIIYQAGISNIMAMGITGCTSKDLIYGDLYPDTGMQVFHVNSKGDKEIIPADPDTYNTTSGMMMPSYGNKSDDKKGFFISFTDTNTLNTSFVRYRNK